MSRLAPLALLSAIGLLFTSGCSHYRLGTGVRHDYDSIFVAPVETNGKMPQATAILTTHIREAFIRDGRLRVVNTPAEADAVLTVNIGGLKREVLTALPTDGGLARKMGVTLAATATLKDPASDKVWFSDREISVERQIFTDDGGAVLQPVQQIQAEYQLVPQLAEPLAASLKGAVLDTW